MRLRSALLAAPLLAALALGACSKSGGGDGTASAAQPGSTGKFTAPEYVMGKASAPVSVVEYLSNTCSHCARFDAEVFPAIKKQYIDTGKVKWTIREFLTPPEQFAAAGFVLARCAGRDKYWGVVEALFHSQEQLFKGTDPKVVYGNIAKSMGMSDSQFQACLSDDSLYKGVSERMQKAVDQDHIDGTPTFIVNGKKLNPGDKLAGRPFNGGELPIDQFQAAYAAAGGK